MKSVVADDKIAIVVMDPLCVIFHSPPARVGNVRVYGRRMKKSGSGSESEEELEDKSASEKSRKKSSKSEKKKRAVDDPGQARVRKNPRKMISKRSTLMQPRQMDPSRFCNQWMLFDVSLILPEMSTDAFSLLPTLIQIENYKRVTSSPIRANLYAKTLWEN